MRNYMKKALLALMVGLGIMGAVGAEVGAIEVRTYIDDPGEPVMVHPNTTGQYEFLAGQTDTVFGVCDTIAKFHTGNGRIYQAIKTSTYVSLINGDVFGFSNMGWLSCQMKFYDVINPEKVYTSNMDGRVWVLWGERECPEGTVGKGGVCVPENQCPGDLVGDGNGNCVCPQGMEPAPVSAQGVQTFAATGATPQQCVPQCDKEKGEVWDSEAEECVLECPDFDDRPEARDKEGNIIEYYAYVACRDEKRQACAWLNPHLRISPEAQHIARDCALVHEQYHIDNEQCFGGKCNEDNYVDGLQDKYFHADEVAANYADFVCLAKGHDEGCSASCTTSECVKSCQEAIIVAAINARDKKNDHVTDYCAKLGISRDNCREEFVDFTCRDGVSQPKLPEIPR